MDYIGTLEDVILNREWDCWYVLQKTKMV